jgi:hypothetical protein
VSGFSRTIPVTFAAMIFQMRVLERIRDGRVTLAFRRWQRPTVRSGGTLMTALGQLAIVSVVRIDAARISEADARRAGYDSRERLMAELSRRTAGDLYRIELGTLKPDPRVAVRDKAELTEVEIAAIRQRLNRLDARSATGPWTNNTLDLLRRHPGVRAGDLCGQVGQEKEPFKLNVRKLKNLGLLESLEVGYRLSPRGIMVLRAL